MRRSNFQWFYYLLHLFFQTLPKVVLLFLISDFSMLIWIIPCLEVLLLHPLPGMCFSTCWLKRFVYICHFFPCGVILVIYAYIYIHSIYVYIPSRDLRGKLYIPRPGFLMLQWYFRVLQLDRHGLLFRLEKELDPGDALFHAPDWCSWDGKIIITLQRGGPQHLLALPMKHQTRPYLAK